MVLTLNDPKFCAEQDAAIYCAQKPSYCTQKRKLIENLAIFTGKGLK